MLREGAVTREHVLNSVGYNLQVMQRSGTLSKSGNGSHFIYKLVPKGAK